MRWISSDQIWKVFFEVPAEDYVHLADFHQFGICPTEQVAIGEVKTVARRFIIRLLGVGYFVTLLLMVMALAYLVGNRVNEWTTGAVAAILLIGTLIPSAYWRKTRSSGLSRLRRMVTPNMRFRRERRHCRLRTRCGNGRLAIHREDMGVSGSMALVRGETAVCDRTPSSLD